VIFLFDFSFPFLFSIFRQIMNLCEHRCVRTHIFFSVGRLLQAHLAFTSTSPCVSLSLCFSPSIFVLSPSSLYVRFSICVCACFSCYHHRTFTVVFCATHTYIVEVTFSCSFGSVQSVPPTVLSVCALLSCCSSSLRFVVSLASFFLLSISSSPRNKRSHSGIRLLFSLPTHHHLFFPYHFGAVTRSNYPQ
jgi:hypothetical protein